MDAAATHDITAAQSAQLEPSTDRGKVTTLENSSWMWGYKSQIKPFAAHVLCQPLSLVLSGVTYIL